MSGFVGDRVKESIANSGTGNLNVGSSAVAGFVTFPSVFPNNVSIYYALVDYTSGIWEVGRGYITFGNTFNRDEVYAGSSGPGVKITLVGTNYNELFCTLPAKAVLTKGIAAADAGLAMP